MYLISYDIDKDKVRNKIAKILENNGKRVQYSVFECDITTDRYESLYSQLAEVMSGEIEGNIRFYHLCKACQAQIAILGVKQTNYDWPDDEKDLFIV